ncbi:hypothetical protein CDV31_015322 [Fusarium ambrosium]|nr:hypothetical protein CDV31_015322 [Fusarium ambrosium]
MAWNYHFLLFISTLVCHVLAASVGIEPVKSDVDLTTPWNGFHLKRAVPIVAHSPDRISTRVSKLKKLNRKHQLDPRSAASLLAKRNKEPFSLMNGIQNISAVGDFSTSYAIQCEWDSTPVWLTFDTASSDTWAVKSGFRCENNLGDKQDQDWCGFGQPHIEDFGLESLPEIHLHRSYESGEEVSGPMGISDISCGTVTVHNQQVGLANRTYWHGDNVTVGVLGLAYPSLTSGYLGSSKDETEWNNYPYTPWLTKAIAQGQMHPMFSVWLDRNSSDGMLSWGGLPRPAAMRLGRLAITDLIIAKLDDREKTAWKPSFYTIIPDGLTWGSRTDTGKYPYIIDTATTMIHVPPPLAEAIAAAFEPQAVYLYQWGSYFVPCDSIAPNFAVNISGTSFWVNPADLIFKDLVDPGTGYCATAITTGGSGPYILGDVFLQNVLAVFDVGNAKMRFYARM